MDGFRKPKQRPAPPSEPRRLVPRPPSAPAERPAGDDGPATEVGEPVKPGAIGQSNGPGRPSEPGKPGEPGPGGKRALLLLVPIVVILGAVLIGVSFASVGDPSEAAPPVVTAPKPSPTPTFTPTFSPVDPSEAEPEEPPLLPPVVPPVDESVIVPPAPPVKPAPPRSAPPRPKPKPEPPRQVAGSRQDRPAPKPAPKPAPRPAPRPAPKPAPKPAPRPVPKPTFTAIGGEDCQHSSRQGYSVVGNDSDWFKKAPGGLAGSGCKGTFRAIPKTGDANRDDPRKFVVWWFKPGFRSGSCKTFVFIPNSTSSDGKPAFYQVIRSNEDHSVVADFRLDQTRNRGKFVSAGTFKITNGNFAVKLRNRGSKSSGTHVTASQVKVSCTAA